MGVASVLFTRGDGRDAQPRTRGSRARADASHPEHTHHLVPAALTAASRRTNRCERRCGHRSDDPAAEEEARTLVPEVDLVEPEPEQSHPGQPEHRRADRVVERERQAIAGEEVRRPAAREHEHAEQCEPEHPAEPIHRDLAEVMGGRGRLARPGMGCVFVGGRRSGMPYT